MRPESAELLDFIHDELKQTLTSIHTGEIWLKKRFSATPKAWQVLRDITLAGNGIKFPTELLFENIINTSKEYQVVLQTLLYRSELIKYEKYIEDFPVTLSELKNKDLKVVEIQIHSLARTPVEHSKLIGVELVELEEIAKRIQAIFPHTLMTLPAQP
jgi:hypothetical protein